MKLPGKITIRHAKELAAAMQEALAREQALTIDAGAVEEIDTAILQLLCSLRRTLTGIAIVHPSQAFLNAAFRCGLQQALLQDAKENA